MRRHFRSSNPLLRESVYEQSYALTDNPMTISGTAGKLLILSLIMIAAAYLTYSQYIQGHMDFVSMLMIGGIAISFILAIVLAFKPMATPYLAPVYAFCQGAVVSGVSCQFESVYKGIVMQAASMTFLTVLVMALLFITGILKATEKFRGVLVAGTMTIFVFYLISFILQLCGINVPYFSQNSILNIVINVIIAMFAALWLVLDFDFIQNGVEKGVPAVFEWYGAFSLLVTVVWLYMEILRLLFRLRSR